MMFKAIYQQIFSKSFEYHVPYTIQETLYQLQQHADNPNHGLSRWQRIRLRPVMVDVKFSGHNPYHFKLHHRFVRLGDMVTRGVIIEQKNGTALSGETTITPTMPFFVSIVFIIWVIYWLLNGRYILASMGILFALAVLLVRWKMFHEFKKRMDIALTLKHKSESQS